MTGASAGAAFGPVGAGVGLLVGGLAGGLLASKNAKEQEELAAEQAKLQEDAAREQARLQKEMTAGIRKSAKRTAASVPPGDLLMQAAGGGQFDSWHYDRFGG